MDFLILAYYTYHTRPAEPNILEGIGYLIFTYIVWFGIAYIFARFDNHELFNKNSNKNPDKTSTEWSNSLSLKNNKKERESYLKNIQLNIKHLPYNFPRDSFHSAIDFSNLFSNCFICIQLGLTKEEIVNEVAREVAQIDSTTLVKNDIIDFANFAITLSISSSIKNQEEIVNTINNLNVFYKTKTKSRYDITHNPIAKLTFEKFGII